MQTYRIALTGDKPLLMHNIQLADPLNKFSKALKVVTSKRIKTDEDHAEMAKIEFLGSLYWTQENGPYVPEHWFHKCLVEAARMTKKGKEIERAVFVDSDAPLIYDGPRGGMDLFSKGDLFMHNAMVKVGQARVMRTRPIFRQWGCEFMVEVDTERINGEDFEAICEAAGRYVGLGDWRPRFGRFSVQVSN